MDFRNPPVFRSSDERQDALAAVMLLHQAGCALADLPGEPCLEAYRLDVQADWPALPTPSELRQAREVLRQVAACYGHFYNRRLGPNDWPFNLATLDEPDPTQQDNAPPF